MRSDASSPPPSPARFRGSRCTWLSRKWAPWWRRCTVRGCTPFRQLTWSSPWPSTSTRTPTTYSLSGYTSLHWCAPDAHTSQQEIFVQASISVRGKTWVMPPPLPRFNVVATRWRKMKTECKVLLMKHTIVKWFFCHCLFCLVTKIADLHHEFVKYCNFFRLALKSIF